MKKRKSNKKPFFRFVKSIVRLFIKDPQIINEENILHTPAIYISNHCAAKGPSKYELFFPANFRLMGAYQMCGSLRERWNYLYHIYFHQKKHFAKWLSFIVATLVLPFMVCFYKGMQLVPVFNDHRFRKTIDISVKSLEKDVNLLLFPEDSSEGYFDEMRYFFGGFWTIAKEFHKRTGRDIHIVSMYFHKELNKILVDKPFSYVELKDTIKNHKDAADFFLKNTNKLYYQLEATVEK